MRIHIEEFKCLKGLTLDLNGLTVLRGRGRTTFFEAMLAADDPSDPRAHLERDDGTVVEWSDILPKGAGPQWLIPSTVNLVPYTRESLGLLLGGDLSEDGSLQEWVKSRMGAPERALIERWGVPSDARSDGDILRHWTGHLDREERRLKRDLERAESRLVPAFERLPSAQLERDIEFYAGKCDVLTAQLRDTDHEIARLYSVLAAPYSPKRMDEDEEEGLRAKIRANHETRDRLQGRRAEMSEDIRKRREELWRREHEDESRNLRDEAAGLVESLGRVRRVLESDSVRYREGRRVERWETLLLKYARLLFGHPMDVSKDGVYALPTGVGVGGFSHTERWLWEAAARLSYAEVWGWPWAMLDPPDGTTFWPAVRVLKAREDSFDGAVVGMPQFIDEDPTWWRVVDLG